MFLHMGKFENLKLTLNTENVIRLSLDDEYAEGGLALQTQKPKLKRPSLYKVVILNDDYTPMEFVIEVLQRFFCFDREDATRIMLKVHHEGKATCGIYSRDVAETKAAQVNQFARDHEHPLLSDIEVVEGDDD